MKFLDNTLYLLSILISYNNFNDSLIEPQNPCYIPRSHKYLSNKLVDEKGAVNKFTPYSFFNYDDDYLANDPGTIGVKKEKMKATKKNPREQMLKYKC